MAGREKYWISCVRSGKPFWVTGFDEVGVFTISSEVRLAAVFDSFDKVHHAKAFLEACNPLVPFDMFRYISIPCRAVSRPDVAQRAING